MSPFDFLGGIMYTLRIMPPRRPPQKLPGRGRWSAIETSCHLLGVFAMGGCIRFSSDVPADAAYDAPIDVSGDIIFEAEAGRTPDPPDASIDVGSAPDTSDEPTTADASDDGDAPAKPADAPPDATPICQRFDPAVAKAIASEMVSTLLKDCKIRSAFISLPPVRLEHFEECFAAQVASVLGCLHPDGTRFKYPAYDSKGQFCRDMKTGHASLTTSDGDFDAFVAAIGLSMMKNGLTDDEIVRALRSFGAGGTRTDIVKLKDAGPTMSLCEGGVDAAAPPAEASPPEAAPREAGPDVSVD